MSQIMMAQGLAQPHNFTVDSTARPKLPPWSREDTKKGEKQSKNTLKFLVQAALPSCACPSFFVFQFMTLFIWMQKREPDNVTKEQIFPPTSYTIADEYCFLTLLLHYLQSWASHRHAATHTKSRATQCPCLYRSKYHSSWPLNKCDQAVYMFIKHTTRLNTKLTDNSTIDEQRINQLQKGKKSYHCSAILGPCDWCTPKESSWNQE